MLAYESIVGLFVIFVALQLIQGIANWRERGTREIPSQFVALFAGLGVLRFPHSDVIDVYVAQFSISASWLQVWVVLMLCSFAHGVARFAEAQVGTETDVPAESPYLRVPSLAGFRADFRSIELLFSSGSMAIRLRTRAAQYALVGAWGAAYSLVWWGHSFLDRASSEGRQVAVMFASGCIFCVCFCVFRWRIGSNEVTEGSAETTVRTHPRRRPK